MPLAPGHRLGPYEILAPIGAGGMGEVYRARDTRLGREVAVKVLPPHLAANPGALARFEREARAVAALSHPNILAIHDFGSDQGVSYAVTELLEGETLRDRLERSPLGWRRAAEMAVALAEGLAAAHAKQITHRDLKPANIFLTSDGRVKILDFGLARSDPAPGDQDATAGPETEPGTILGTVGYMSPEQVRGSPADPRSDIFSFGCVLYEMVTGQQAFARPTGPETMAAILNEDPPPAAGSGKEIPAELERIVTHCLEKNPPQRFQSARDLAFALQALRAPAAAPSARPAAPRWSRRAVWAAAAVVVLAALAAFLYLRGGSGKQIQSLAVLPFANAGADPNTEYLSEGITESLINSLSQLPNLAVRSRSMVQRYKGKDADARAAGRELGVDAVLSGRLTQRDQALAISIEVVDAATGNHLWGEQYNRTLAGLLAVQEEITRDITDKLRLRLTGQQKKSPAKRSTDNAEAYQLYLKGRYHWNKRSADGLRTAIDYFQQAIGKDPGYALAHAGLADCYTMLGNYFILSPNETYPKARAAATRALEIDEQLAQAHTSLAGVKVWYEWDWNGADREFRRAVELNPQDATAHQWYSYYYLAMGKGEQALRQYRKALELDPLSLPVTTFYGQMLIFNRQYDQATEHLRKALEMDPGFGPAHWILGQAHVNQGRYQEAIAEFEKAPATMGGGPGPTVGLALVYATSGRRAEALKALKEAKRSMWQVQAAVYAQLGQKDEAFAELEKAFQDRSLRPDTLRLDPAMDPLRSDPRWANLMRRVGLE